MTVIHHCYLLNRKFASKMGCIENLEFGINLASVRVADSGDVPSELSLEDAHQHLGECKPVHPIITCSHFSYMRLTLAGISCPYNPSADKIRDFILCKQIPVVIGGGNDQVGHFRGSDSAIIHADCYHPC